MRMLVKNSLAIAIAVFAIFTDAAAAIESASVNLKAAPG